MRGIFKPPKQLGAHRQAAIALYRALLTQCTRLELPQNDIEWLKNVVRNRFRVARPQRMRLSLAFQSGYHALDLLDSSVAGDATATARIQDLLSRTPDHLHRSPLANRPHEKPKNLANGLPPEEFKFENMFPRLKVKGIRKVPFMVNASGLPFIRWKKPQPQNVSRVLSQKLVQRQKRNDLMNKLELELIPMARCEDEWESRIKLMLRADGRAMNGEEDNETYLSPITKYDNELKRIFWLESYKTRQRIERFANIIFKERQLAEKEKAERVKAQNNHTLNDS